MEDPPPILGYQRGTPPVISGFAYFRVVISALIRLFFSFGLAGIGLLGLVLGMVDIAGAGHPEDLACASVVWGPIFIVIGVRGFLRAIEILMEGRMYNRHY